MSSSNKILKSTIVNRPVHHQYSVVGILGEGLCYSHFFLAIDTQNIIRQSPEIFAILAYSKYIPILYLKLKKDLRGGDAGVLHVGTAP